ncbi:MAG: metallophosphoesterase family protein [Bacillota bacterium]
MDYVIGDVHGYLDAFVELVNKISLTAQDNLYIIGDVIDRGQRPVDMLQLVMHEKNMHFILGNHEDMLLNYVKDGSTERWMRNGGEVTLRQWQKLPAKRRRDLADYLHAAPLYRKVGRFLLVHAGIMTPEEIPDTPKAAVDEILATQTRTALLWSREDFFNRPALAETTVVFGHTSTARIRGTRGLDSPPQLSIWHDELYHDKIGIDCGSYRPGGQLGCLRLDDLTEFYVPTNLPEHQ